MKYVFLMLYAVCVTCEGDSIETLCEDLDCEDEGGGAVCGMRVDGPGFRIRQFESQCELLKFGCSAKDETAYGIINMEYCNKVFHNTSADVRVSETILNNNIASKQLCFNYDCSFPEDAGEVCTIRNDGSGFKIRLFKDKCHLLKHNCENDQNFTITDDYICNGLNVSEAVRPDFDNDKRQSNPVFIVDGLDFNANRSVNETIEDFFAATHVFDLPVRNIESVWNEESRRKAVNIFGPRVVFVPWTVAPENRSEDYDYKPTLNSCYHKCPTKCPDFYVPVCAAPGAKAREPTLMFKNHCWMDVAQCRMYWEAKSETAQTSGLHNVA